MTVEPITPDEIGKHKKKHIPNEVIQAFNSLIAKKWNGKSAKVKQDEVIKEICSIFQQATDAAIVDTRNKIFAENWLNVEDIYEDAGWKVTYDKPAYCETYDAYFEFRKK